MMYNPQKIERKWQRVWEKEKIYKSRGKGKKFYVLDMFPYPSGEGLHVGHPRGYIATDVVARFKMRRGFDVLHPMGWDAFGLPAENYALANNIHPKISVSKNIKRFKEQMNKIGFTYDWNKEINTTDPQYYKWTQWIFLKMFESGLVYGSEEPIVWCPSCKTGLALEDLEDGKCERCGSEVEKKPLRQWVLKMTAYAEKLLNDLKSLDWPQPIIDQQRNWIGKSEGAIIKFVVRSSKSVVGEVEVFTTRLDTIFGCTYLVVAPEHLLVKNLKSNIKNYDSVQKYVNQAQKKTDLARTDLAKDKTGVELKGVKARNPFNNEEVPIFVADYVLGSYGTGAVMAVPAHDERDWEFAKKYKLPIRMVICPNYPEPKCPVLHKAYVDDGHVVDSQKFTGLTSQKAREEMVKWLEKNKLGGKKINYKMRDWVFARQRYWGEPFPLVYCQSCADRINNKKYKKGEFTKGELMNPGWIQIPEKSLPVKLPEVKQYEPSGTGESPLANIKDWVTTKCPKCNGHAYRETNTMPQWAGSNWYYIAYLMKRGGKYVWDKKEIKKWLPVDLYVGGVEHATRHLLYARFWYKFLYDIKAVFNKEPFQKLMNQGLILAEDGRKMSKRWKNVINPDDIIKNFGADTLRLYEMFMGPFIQSIAWSTDGLRGMKRFLDRVWKMRDRINPSAGASTELSRMSSGREARNKKLEIFINQTIKKVTEDIEGFKFNTAVSALMVLANELEKESSIDKKHYLTLVSLLSPFVPHFSEELWRGLKGKNSIHLEKWPDYNPKLIYFDEFDLVVQINGKVRDKISVSKGISQKEAEEVVLNLDKIKQFIGLLGSSKIKKIIFVPNRLINIVI
ncbi:MAG: leucine--tRNA ligase [Candidatus Wolfebacteria bacterium]|nr:leucine--tRNA ligase [Candidatus Wolfebacteria bacterium]